MNKNVLKIAAFGAIMAVMVDYMLSPTVKKTVGIK
jgi:hypothetical protein